MEAGAFEAFLDNARVVAVVVQRFLYLLCALFGVDSRRAALDDIGSAVELGALTAVPHGVQALAVAHKRLGHHGVAAACAGEAGGFREGTELDGAGLGAFHLIDGMGHVLFGDEALVRSVEHDDGAVLVGVIHPNLQLVGIQNGAGGVVGAAQVDDVGNLVGERGDEIVFGRGGHVDDVRPALGFLVVFARTAGHGVGVNIHGVHRVAYGYLVVDGKDVADVAAVALGAVGNEDLVVFDIYAAGTEVVFGNGGAQEVVALLGAVAVEVLERSHVVHGGMHGIDNRRRQRAGYVADAHLDHLRLGMRRGVLGGTAGNLGKQVATGKLCVVLVDVGHGKSPLHQGAQTTVASAPVHSFHAAYHTIRTICQPRFAADRVSNENERKAIAVATMLGIDLFAQRRGL